MFLTLILAVALATNSSVRADESVLRTAAEVYALCELPHAPKTPFEVRGTVVYANIYGYAVVEDASGRAFFFNGKGDTCHIGDDVVITGLAGVPNPHGHIPWMWNVSVRVVGQGKVPEPRDIRLANIGPELPDLSTIRVEGEVLDVFPDEIDAVTEFLVLRDGGKSTLVSFSTPDTALRRSLERLALARIRLTGTYFRHMSGNRLFSGPSITLSSTNDITVLAPAPADPFDAPPLNSIIRETPDEIAALGRRSVVGTVIAVWRGNRVLVKTEEYADATLRIDERTRLAVELHDSLSQTLTGVSYQINAAARALEADPAQVSTRLDIARQTLQSCRNELRNCLWDLRNEALEEKDAAEAIRKTLAPHSGDAKVSVIFDANRAKISDTTFHAVLRMIRELVINAVRHGEARHVDVRGDLDSQQLVFSVTDDGKGFNPENRPGQRDGHFGLQGIQERLNRLDGHMDITSTPGSGTCVTITIRSCRKQES